MVQLLLQAARPVHEAQEPLLPTPAIALVEEAVEELRGVGLPEDHPLERGGLVLFCDWGGVGVVGRGKVSWWGVVMVGSGD